MSPTTQLRCPTCGRPPVRHCDTPGCPSWRCNHCLRWGRPIRRHHAGDVLGWAWKPFTPRSPT